MSTVVSNEATNLPPSPVDPPGITGEQLVNSIPKTVADAKKLKEQEDRIAGLETKGAEDALKLKEKEEKGAEDALKLKEKDETITKWKGIAGAFGILSFAMSSTLALNITEWAAAFAIWMFLFPFFRDFRVRFGCYQCYPYVRIGKKVTN